MDTQRLLEERAQPPRSINPKPQSRTKLAESRRVQRGANFSGDRSPGAQAVVLAAARASMTSDSRAALAVVVETEGSVYAKRGSLALLSSEQHVGWLSGGCLEPALLANANLSVEERALRILEIDNLDDSALFSGGATGCRGRQIVALFPLSALPCLGDAIDAWLADGASIDLTVMASGQVRIECGEIDNEVTLPVAPFKNLELFSGWSIRLAPPPRVLLLGTGPEATYLSPMLRDLGWQVKCRDPRANWRDSNGITALDGSVPVSKLLADFSPDAVLLMHHNFELDLESLLALEGGPCDFVGLLGPARRREDLLKLLTPDLKAELTTKLRSPVGLCLGSSGPAGIALSVCAELEHWRSLAGRASGAA